MKRVVTAEYLRKRGANIPKNVPDCAKCTLADLQLDDTFLDEDGLLRMTFSFGLATPFRWNESQLELEDGRRITTVWPFNDADAADAAADDAKE